MLEKSPALRPQLPSEVAASCYHIIQELGLQTPSVLTPPLPHAPQTFANAAWRTHLPWAIPLAVFITCFSFWTLYGSGPAEVIQFPQNKSVALPVLPGAALEESLSQETPEKKKLDSSESTLPPGEAKAQGTATLESESPDQPKSPGQAKQPESSRLKSSESPRKELGLNLNLPPESTRPPGNSSPFEIIEAAPLPSDSSEKPLAESFSIDATLPP